MNQLSIIYRVHFFFDNISLNDFPYCIFRTPIITTKPSEDHTYSAGGGAKQGNAVSTIVNVTPNGAEPTVHFNGNSTPPTVTHQIQIKHDTSPINNGHDIIIDNRHSDNMSNGTSSDAAYESSEDR